MEDRFANPHRWALILAGGDGIRLRHLTRFVSAEDTPKQFCKLWGGRTLLGHTRQRVARLISPERTAFVLRASHERFISAELADAPSWAKMAQPSDRGTLAAVSFGITQLLALDSQAVVAVFPSDHYYENEAAFTAGIDLALAAAEDNPESVVLIGAPASFAATECGWIEACAGPNGDYRGVLGVKNFWEKPSVRLARELFERGCVWNTFIMVGRADAFQETIRATAPEYCQAFLRLPGEAEASYETRLQTVFARLAADGFSERVLSGLPRQLGVFCLGDVGWSDLGDPQRLLETMTRAGIEENWMDDWQRETARAEAEALACAVGF
jgi:mannose-1-phosphate guanylyltransferase